MKYIIPITATLLVSSMLCSCDVYQVNPNPNPDAPVEDFVSVSVSTVDKTVLWSNQDTLAGFLGDEICHMFLNSSTEASPQAVFHSARKIAYKPSYIYMVYPYSAKPVLSDTKLIVNFPERQLCRAGGGVDRKTDFMFAKADDKGNAVMESTCGFLKLSLTGEDKTLASVIIRDPNHKLSGDGVILLSDNEHRLQIRNGVRASDSVILELESVVNLTETPVELTAVLPAAEYESLKLTLICQNGESKTFDSPCTISCRSTVECSLFYENEEPPVIEGTNLNDPEGSGISAYANCFIVSAPGKYYFSVKDALGVEISGVQTVDWLWALGAGWTTDEGKTVSEFIENLEYDAANGLVKFEVPSEFKAGNVSLAVIDDRGYILWSWHIWLTEKPSLIAVGSGADAFEIMDRNLGATSAAAGSAESLGLLYQWDRKDPFPGAAGIGRYVQWTPETVAKQSAFKENATYNNTGDGYTAFNIVNTDVVASWRAWSSGDFPTRTDESKDKVKFTNNAATHYEWAAAPTTTSHRPSYNPSYNDPKWQPVADPCPLGYQVMNQTQLKTFSGVGTTAIAISTGSQDGVIISDHKTMTNDSLLGLEFIAGGNKVWMPATGYREANKATFGGVADTEVQYSCLRMVGHYARYAVADKSTASGYNFRFTPTQMVLETTSVSSLYGSAVRCVKKQ